MINAMLGRSMSTVLVMTCQVKSFLGGSRRSRLDRRVRSRALRWLRNASNFDQVIDKRAYLEWHVLATNVDCVQVGVP
jgi:cytidylate kinase